MGPVSRRLLPAIAALAVLPFASCSDERTLTQPPLRALFTTPTGLVTAIPPQILAGAGDISTCGNNNDEATARLLDTISGTVFTAGDNVMPNGSTSEFANCYNPTWGRHKARTRPAAGNHDYNTSGAAGYFGYFGGAAGEFGKGYYSYDLGAWHVIVLNSNISRSAGSAQDKWLLADLAAHPNLCTVAYFHHPLYSSTGGTGTGGTTYSSSRRFWDDMYPAGVDLILGGHRHFYERLAPMKPDGTRDATYGIREIVVGTGGDGGGTLTNLFPTSEVREGHTFGVLKLYLYPDSYAWKFLPVAGKTFTDSGSTACHGAPGSGGGGGVSASLSTVVAAPGSIAAGSASATITVTAKDGSGNPVSGATVVLSSTGTGNTITQPAGTTNSSGVASGTISSTMAETKTVSAVVNGVALSQKASVTVTPAAAAALAFATQPSNTQANAPITPAVTVEIRDQYGNRVSSSASVAMAIGTNPGSGTLTGTTPQAAVAGVATFSDLAINKTATGYTLIASSSGLSSATSSAFNITAPAPSASLSTVVAGTPTFTAGGSSAITVTVKDGLGNPLSGVPVTLSSSVGGDVVTQPAATTNGSGVTSGSVSATSAGARTITAVASGVTLNQKPALTVTAGSPNAGTSTVSASPTTITAGSGSSTITVTVRDLYGNPVGGSLVTLTASGTGNTLTQPAPTNSSGGTTGSLSSSNVQTVTVSASADGVAITQSASVTVTDQPPPAAITHTLLTSGNNVTNMTTYTTASIAPAPNALITIVVMSQQSTSAAANPIVTGGGMIAWDTVKSVVFDNVSAPHQRVTIYRAMSAAPGSGPITIKFAVNVSHCEWIVSQWSGVATSGTNGAGAIVQTGSNAADAVNGLAVVLAPFGSPNNVAFGAFGVVKSTIAVTPGSGFTEIDEQPSAEGSTSASDLQTEWAVNLNIVNAIWASLNGGALAVELKAGP